MSSHPLTAGFSIRSGCSEASSLDASGECLGNGEYCVQTAFTILKVKATHLLLTTVPTADDWTDKTSHHSANSLQEGRITSMCQKIWRWLMPAISSGLSLTLNFIWWFQITFRTGGRCLRWSSPTRVFSKGKTSKSLSQNTFPEAPPEDLSVP